MLWCLKPLLKQILLLHLLLIKKLGKNTDIGFNNKTKINMIHRSGIEKNIILRIKKELACSKLCMNMSKPKNLSLDLKQQRPMLKKENGK